VSDEQGPIDDRRDVLVRRILAQGRTPEEWAVEVAQPVQDVWTTYLYVGVRGFRLAYAEADNEGETHCMFIGQAFVKALEQLREPDQRAHREVGVLSSLIIQSWQQKSVEPLKKVIDVASDGFHVVNLKDVP
jgi:hypothetical protein